MSWLKKAFGVDIKENIQAAYKALREVRVQLREQEDQSPLYSLVSKAMEAVALAEDEAFAEAKEQDAPLIEEPK